MATAGSARCIPKFPRRITQNRSCAISTRFANNRAMTEPGRLFISAMHIVPTKPLSRMLRRLASVQSKLAVGRFAARYSAAIEEAERPIDEYESVLAFFTRRLKPGLRPLDPNLDVLSSPVDGAFLAGGPIGEGKLFQAKGRTFTLNALLADDQA